jgi:hypothetical protein
MRVRASWSATVAAIGLVLVAAALLYAQGQVRFGNTPVEIHGSEDVLAALAGLIAVATALVVKPARIPVAVTIVVVTALIAVGGAAGVLAFYDSGGLGLALGIACLAALWLALAGRRTQRPWTRDLARRLSTYLTVGAIGIPFVGVAGVTAACSGASGDDDICGLGWVLIGVPATISLWLVAAVVSEVAAARRRRRSDCRGTPRQPTG